MVEGVNSTQVHLVWNFTAPPSSGFVVSIKRRRPGSQATQLASRSSTSDNSTIFNVREPADYEANFPATLVIKDITRNDENFYSVGILNTNTGSEELFDEVPVDVVCKSELAFGVLLYSYCLPNATRGFVP